MVLCLSWAEYSMEGGKERHKNTLDLKASGTFVETERMIKNTEAEWKLME